MNHYPHHIGDFNNATRHLTRIERSVYRDLIELYYDTEQPLPGDNFDRLARRVLAASEEEKTALHAVLDEFFTLTEGVYVHARCEREIQKYQGLRDVASKAGRASAERRSNARSTPVERPLNAGSTPVERPLNDRATNQEPRTNNQEPNTTQVVEAVGDDSGAGPSPAALATQAAQKALDDAAAAQAAAAAAEDKKARKAKRKPLPKPFVLPKAMGEWAMAEAHWDRERVLKVAETFADYWHGTGEVKADWDATWRNWVRREVEKAVGGRGGSGGGHGTPIPSKFAGAANAIYHDDDDIRMPVMNPIHNAGVIDVEARHVH